MSSRHPEPELDGHLEDGAAPTQAICLDFDGTVIDTETAEARAWSLALSEVGVDFDTSAYRSYVGQTGTGGSLAELICQRSGVAEKVGIVEKAFAIAFGDLALDLPPREGITDLAEAASAAGVAISVVSSSPRQWIERQLERIGLLDEIGLIVGREDVGDRRKPDPFPYQLALEQLGVDPERARALEDSPVGVASAEGAKIPVVVVTNEVTEALTFPRGIPVFRSLSEVPRNWFLPEPS